MILANLEADIFNPGNTPYRLGFKALVSPNQGTGGQPSPPRSCGLQRRCRITLLASGRKNCSCTVTTCQATSTSGEILVESTCPNWNMVCLFLQMSILGLLFLIITDPLTSFRQSPHPSPGKVSLIETGPMPVFCSGVSSLLCFCSSAAKRKLERLQQLP